MPFPSCSLSHSHRAPRRVSPRRKSLVQGGTGRSCCRAPRRLGAQELEDDCTSYRGSSYLLVPSCSPVLVFLASFWFLSCAVHRHTGLFSLFLFLSFHYFLFSIFYFSFLLFFFLLSLPYWSVLSVCGIPTASPSCSFVSRLFFTPSLLSCISTLSFFFCTASLLLPFPNHADLHPMLLVCFSSSAAIRLTAPCRFLDRTRPLYSVSRFQRSLRLLPSLVLFSFLFSSVLFPDIHFGLSSSSTNTAAY